MSGGFLQSDDNAINIDNIDIDIDLDNLIDSIVSGNNILSTIDTTLSYTQNINISGNTILSQIENVLDNTQNIQVSGNTILSEIHTDLQTTNLKLGTEGSTPPTITGTGILGWLRGIYEKLSDVLTVTVNNFPTSTPGLTDAELRASPVPVSVSGLSITIPSGTSFQIDLLETNTIISTGNDIVSKIDINLGQQSDSMAANNVGSFSLIALFKRLLDKLDIIKDSLSVFGGTLDSDFTLDYFFQNSATSTLQVSGNNILTEINVKLDNQTTLENQLSGLDILDSIDNKLKSTSTKELLVELSGNNISAFGDINTASFTPLVQLDFVYGINIQTGKSTIVNTGVVDTNLSRLRLQTGTNSTGSAIFESLRPAKYRPGQGIDARFTFAFDTPVANSRQEMGMGNLIDGYFFGYIGTQFGIIHRNNSVETFIPQSDWNVDKCDGTGQSGIVLNPLFGNIGRVKYPFLGYGNIFFLIENPTTSLFMVIHVIRYVNTTKLVQLNNPNLQFWSRIVNTGNTSNLTMYCGSVGVFLSGERKFLGATWGANNNKTGISTTSTNILTIKNCTTYNGIVNKSLIRLTSISFASDSGNSIATLLVIKNATLGGTPLYTPRDGTTGDNGTTITNGSSVASFDVAGTTATGTQQMFNSSLARNSSNFLPVVDLDLFLEPGATMTFACFATASSNIGITVNWSEEV